MDPRLLPLLLLPVLAGDGEGEAATAAGRRFSTTGRAAGTFAVTGRADGTFTLGGDDGEN